MARQRHRSPSDDVSAWTRPDPVEAGRAGDSVSAVGAAHEEHLPAGSPAPDGIHVLLCGDSVFDNGFYVDTGEPDVSAQLRRRLGPGARVTLLAVDGHVTSDVAGQLLRRPGDGTHVFISTGGNDALRHLDLLDTPASSSAEVLDLFASAVRDFETTYRAMLERASACRLPVTLCTIYFPRFDAVDPERLAAFGLGGMEAAGWARFQRNACVALALFNDVILRLAFEAHLPILDLRLICNEDADYANPIEPSARGGEKIAQRIATVLLEQDFDSPRSMVYT